jgi:hypothetical protein
LKKKSALYPTNVTCGAVYASSFSCGAYRASPPQPAVSISLDEVNYRVSAGVVVSKKKRNDDRFAVDFVYDLVRERMGEQRTLLESADNKMDRSSWNALLHGQALLDTLFQKKIQIVDLFVALVTIFVVSAIFAIVAKRK